MTSNSSQPPAAQPRVLQPRRLSTVGNDDPDGTSYEDGSVKGGRDAGDSVNDNNYGGGSGRALIEW